MSEPSDRRDLSFALRLPVVRITVAAASSASQGNRASGDPDFHGGDPSLGGWFLQFFKTYYSHGQIIRITMVALIYTLLLGAPLGNIVVFWALPALGAVAQLFVFGTWLPHRERETPLRTLTARTVSKWARFCRC
ncbi:hypothetical protein QP150_01470 [Sphingomonas sp. 22L2VL55-3]